MASLAHRSVGAFFAAVAALVITAGCGENAAGGNRSGQHILVFASVPSTRFETLQQHHQPVIDMLEKETGMTVRFETSTDYATIIQAMREGKIDVASLGPLSYVLAKQQGAPITAVAARARRKDERPSYQSYGITWAGSPIRTLADFRGKRICFVDRDSTSGYLYPRAALHALGIEPDTDMTPSLDAWSHCSLR